jgi:hypothetical protein
VKLICNLHERSDLQCIVIENGVQCDHGVRNKSRMLCTRHYSRYQRSGGVDLLLPNGGSLPRRKQQTLLQRKEDKLKEDGSSVVCLCTHVFLKHSNRNGCRENRCRCKKFESTNVILLAQTIQSMRKIGFSNPLNDSALCLACDTYVVVGYWHDRIAIKRMKEHLRLYHLTRRNLRVV